MSVIDNTEKYKSQYIFDKFQKFIKNQIFANFEHFLSSFSFDDERSKKNHDFHKPVQMGRNKLVSYSPVHTCDSERDSAMIRERFVMVTSLFRASIMIRSSNRIWN